MKIHEFIEATKEFNRQLEVPYKVSCALGGVKNITTFGETIQLTQDGDYLDVDEARSVISWIADQLGGKVTWNKE